MYTPYSAKTMAAFYVPVWFLLWGSCREDFGMHSENPKSFCVNWIQIAICYSAAVADLWKILFAGRTCPVSLEVIWGCTGKQTERKRHDSFQCAQLYAMSCMLCTYQVPWVLETGDKGQCKNYASLNILFLKSFVDVWLREWLLSEGDALVSFQKRSLITQTWFNLYFRLQICDCSNGCPWTVAWDRLHSLKI